MKHIGSFIIALVLLFGLVGPAQAASTTAVIPTISIVSVDAGKTVTIKTNNYPANDTFDVLMGKFGTRGVGGTKVDTISSGKGGSLSFTFAIPEALKNEKMVAIRLQSPSSGYYSYNWFYNQTSSGIPTTGDNPGTIPAGTIPTISITSVDPGKTVTIKTNNYPANDTFDVYMGKMGTRGVGGVKVTSVSSGTGGAQTFTFNIPDSLKSDRQVAIRLQSPKSGYYSYNWFYNDSAGVPPTGGDGSTPGKVPAGTVPTISIASVVKDSTVTVTTKNYPANDTFNVYMGKMGTRGVGGVKVDAVSSATGGAQTYTFTIPDSLKGNSQIAIRLESPLTGYYSYNWFWNATSP